MNLKFYSLMYIDLDEKRYLSGKTYKNEERLDLYVKGSCVLDKSLKINGLRGGVNILTNNRTLILKSLERLHYTTVNVIEIPFSLNVPKGIPFYSAHFKIDVFNYLGTRPQDEYSILLDSDVVCLHDFSDEFYSIINEGVPTVYYLNTYGGEKKLRDVRQIDNNINWLPWAGGEYIGGTSYFFSSLYNEINKFKEEYWKSINKGLFHVGDEMLTTIALARLRNKNINPIDVKLFGIIHRFWSIYESKSIWEYNTPLIHLPGDKVFERDIDLNAKTVNELMRGYKEFCIKQRLRNSIKNIIQKFRT